MTAVVATDRAAPAYLSPLRWLARGGSNAALSIFIFHRVLERPDPLRPTEPDAEQFARIASFLARHFRVLPLADGVAALAQGRLPAGAACITFDDGYADNLTVAAPILKATGLPATLFVATGFSGGRAMWNDLVIESVRAAPAGALDWRDFGLGTLMIGDDASRVALVDATLPRLKSLEPDERAAVATEMARRAGVVDGVAARMMLSQQQLLTWREFGLDIGGHTVNHPILARLDDRSAAAEIADNRAQLTEWLGEAPATFAYPNGVPGRDYLARDVELVRRAGYSCAVSTRFAAATRCDDLFQLPRYTPWDRSMLSFGLRCARTLLAARRGGAEAPTISDNREVCS